MNLFRGSVPLAAALATGCYTLDDVPIVVERCAPDRMAVVKDVLDGDTVVVDDLATGDHIRLLGVDAPEVQHNSSDVDQCYGPEARSFLDELVQGVEVRIEFDKVCIDVTGERLLGYLYLPEPGDSAADGVFVNREIIAGGYARFYEEFDDIRLADELSSAEEDAHARGSGLWTACQ